MEAYTIHEAGIVQVRSPLPFPLRWVNSYLIPDRKGWTMLDPGLHTAQAEQHWREVLAQLKIEPSQIHLIVLTHHHPDHYGLAGYMQQLTGGAPVVMAERGQRQVTRMWGSEYVQTADELVGFFTSHGLVEELQPAMHTHLTEFVELVSPQPYISLIEAGQTLKLGDLEYEIFEANGHAYGHLCFYQPDSRRIFCGDHVMPHITPNVAFLPHLEANPLQSYLQSLAEIRTMDVELAYPGHREPFRNWAERIGQLLYHHDKRLEWFVEHLTEPQTAYQVCLALFGDRLSIHQLRFALSETLAHLIFLAEAGKIRVETKNERTFWEGLR